MLRTLLLAAAAVSSTWAVECPAHQTPDHNGGCERELQCSPAYCNNSVCEELSDEEFEAAIEENKEWKFRCVCNEGFYQDKEAPSDIQQLLGNSDQAASCRALTEDDTKSADCSEFSRMECDFMTMKGCFCADIDECAEGNHSCGDREKCENQNKAAPICVCQDGYYNESGTCQTSDEVCQAINCDDSEECMKPETDNNKKTHYCASKCADGCPYDNSSCKKSPGGSYDCQCDSGYSQAGKNKCSKILEDPVEPDVRVVEEDENETNVEVSEPEPESDNELPTVTTQTDIKSGESVDTAGSNQTLFIVGVCVIVIVVIGILLWLKNRKEANDSHESEALNQQGN